MSMPNPIVLLDARARYVHPAFQMTRASTKTVFDSTGKLVTVPANALGWDHDPATGQARGYLAEPSATNLLLHSNDLNQSSWVKYRSSVTPDAIIGPDGDGMAKVVEDTQSGPHAVLCVSSVSDVSAVVFSAVLKAGERQMASLRINEEGTSTTINCSYDLIAGAAGQANASGGATAHGSGAVDLGGGFYRCWIAGALGSGAMNVRFEMRMRDSSGEGYTGDGASGLYFGYAQAETGSYPTSYIETGASTVTRAGDSLVLSGLGDFPWWRSERGALLVDVDIPVRKSAGEFLSVAGSTLSIRWTSTTQALIVPAGITDGGIILLSDDAVGRHIIALSWNGETLAGAVDGSIKNVRDVIGSIPSNPSLGLGCNSGSFNHAQGAIRRAVYYPTRISNADLQSLTAIQE